MVHVDDSDDDVHDDTKGSFSINFALCLLNVLYCCYNLQQILN